MSAVPQHHVVAPPGLTRWLPRLLFGGLVVYDARRPAGQPTG